MVCTVESSNKNAHAMIPHRHNRVQHLSNVACVMLSDSNDDPGWHNFLLPDIWNALTFQNIFGYLSFNMYPGSKTAVVVNPILCGVWAELCLEHGPTLAIVKTSVYIVPSTATLAAIVATQGPSRGRDGLPVTKGMMTAKDVARRLWTECENGDPSWYQSFLNMHDSPEEFCEPLSFDR